MAADRAHVWHPFTQQRGWADEEPLIVERAEGCELIDTAGRRYIDGVSSLWCTVHGHRHPRIDAAVREQLDRVAHSTMLGLTHPARSSSPGAWPSIAPPGSRACFYSDSGSTATEIALKMAFQLWQQRGGGEARRTRFISLRDAYHGDTIGSVSVGGIDLFHATYRPLLFDTLKAEPGDAADMERLLEAHRGEIAAVIMEPLVQGAAGMLVHPDGYLRAVRELCDRARRAADLRRGGHRLRPHRAACSPASTRASHPTCCAWPRASPAATCRSPPRSPPRTVYEGFLGEFEEFRTFFHGHTYTGNPLACAAALATPRRVRGGAHARAARAQDRAARRAAGRRVEAMPEVAEVRRCGFMTGIELRRSPGRRADGPPGHARGAPPRRDRPPARRHRRADAAAGDLDVRAAPPGRDHRGVDRGGLRGRWRCRAPPD